MGEHSKIEWTDHTFNPWVGCTRVSPACDHCYAEGWAKRTGQAQLWTGERRRTSDANWRLPTKWHIQAERLGHRPRVFCASLADVFDNQVPVQWREDLWALIAGTPNLDWLLLTKRPQNIRKMLPSAGWGNGWKNVWLGTTVENQTEADRRIDHLLDVPAAVHFLSCEPLLGPIDIEPWLHDSDCLSRDPSVGCTCREPRERHISWVIAGGESGHGARPMHHRWVRLLRNQCAGAGTAFHFKQWGEWAPHKPEVGGDLSGEVRAGRVMIVHPTGQTDVEVAHATGGRSTIPGSSYMARIGKKAAGRLLDGREHNEFPRMA